MSELDPLLSKTIVEKQYLTGTSASKAARFALYKLARPEFDPYAFTMGELGLQGDESILDLGCSDAEMLFNLRKGTTIGQNHQSRQYKHRGKLVGVEFDFGTMQIARSNLNDDEKNSVSLVCGVVEDIPFPNNTFDITSAFWMLYHSTNIDKALEEMRRVTKPGGKLVITTSGERNKVRHRAFEAQIAEYLPCDVLPPPIFSASFNTEKATELLIAKFGDHNIKKIRHLGAIILKKGDEDANLTYRLSMDSMRSAYLGDYIYDGWTEAVNEIVVKQILAEQEQCGEFRETVDRAIFIINNPK